MWSASAQAIGFPEGWKAGPEARETGYAFYDALVRDADPMRAAIRATVDSLSRQGYALVELQQPIFPKGKVSRSIEIERTEEPRIYVLKAKYFRGGSPGESEAYRLEVKFFGIAHERDSVDPHPVVLEYKLINAGSIPFPAIGGVTGGTR
jgi:hypothetical protein